MTRDYVAYEEVTPLPAWVWLIVVGSFLAGAWATWRASPGPIETGLAAAVVLLGPLVFSALIGSLRVRVTHSSLVVGFGRLQWIQKHIPFSDIVDIEAVTYSPLLEFGGWGIRFGFGGKRAWTIRGNRAVRLRLRNGKLVYIGSEDPDRLAERIRQAGGGRWGTTATGE